MLRHYDEKFSGWGAEGRDGYPIGLEGYTKERAEQVKQEVIKNMKNSSRTVEILVEVVPMGNNKFYVYNHSAYESDY